jgi:hypothetical protein
MRVRAQDSNGDMAFGFGLANFLIDSVQAVEQLILTGLGLFQGEFFLNTAAGMPWDTEVLGYGTQSLYDNAIQAQIRNTVGVTAITRYSSSLNTDTRLLTVDVTVQTAFGSLSLSITLPFAPPFTSGYGVGGYGVNPFGA